MLTQELRDSIPWERGRLVRIEREARMSDSETIEAPCGRCADETSALPAKRRVLTSPARAR